VIVVTDRILLLLRHAKSDYPEGVADHHRPLAARGRREAALAGEWLRAEFPTIDAVLCSTATRTRETVARTAVDAPTQFLDALYDATPGEVIAQINHAADHFGTDVQTLLVVGHEPAMSTVALGLAADTDTDTEPARRILDKYPTSAIAVLRVPGAWEDLGLGGAELVTFHVPR
jgi:phosphohistidine phosphatase